MNDLEKKLTHYPSDEKIACSVGTLISKAYVGLVKFKFILGKNTEGAKGKGDTYTCFQNNQCSVMSMTLSLN